MFTGGFHAKQVEFKASAAILAALHDMGRTEDLHVSPNGKRLAIVGFAKDRLLVLDIQVRKSGKERVVQASDYLQISSPHLNMPHGLFWVDDNRIITASREGDISLFEVPKHRPDSRQVVLEPVAEITGMDFPALCTPGSVSVFPSRKAVSEVLICNNYVHKISQHQLHLGKQPFFDGHKVLLEGQFDVPDGITHGGSGKLFAVSDHNKRDVKIFGAADSLKRKSKPKATLRGFY